MALPGHVSHVYQGLVKIRRGEGQPMKKGKNTAHSTPSGKQQHMAFFLSCLLYHHLWWVVYILPLAGENYHLLKHACKKMFQYCNSYFGVTLSALYWQKIAIIDAGCADFLTCNNRAPFPPYFSILLLPQLLSFTFKKTVNRWIF